MRQSPRRTKPLNPENDPRLPFASNKLTVRIVSALAMSVVALALTYAGPLPFAFLVTAFVAVMAWEWGRLVCASGLDAAWAVQVGATAVASVLAATDCPGCGLLAIIAGTLAVFVMRRMDMGTAQSWWAATGVYYVGLPSIALVWIRSDPEFGWYAVLFIFIIVWTTDTAAYIFGKMIGGPLLAPDISPKKTWAGFMGGLICAVALGTAVLIGVAGAQAVLPVMALSAVLSLVSQIGDLSESSIKRLFGRKDSSGIIPGHGGVLDRVDGLVFAALTCAVLALLRAPDAPGYALAVWG